MSNHNVKIYPHTHLLMFTVFRKPKRKSKKRRRKVRHRMTLKEKMKNRM